MLEGEEPEYHVDAVEDSRQFREALQHRVRWTGWPSLTWEPWYLVNTTEAVSHFHERYPDKPGLMPEGSEKTELRRRGLNVGSFAGAQSSGGGYCHGLARDHGPSLDQATLPPLPTVVIGNQDASMEAHRVQDLEALSDAVLLWDIRDGATAEESARGSRVRRLLFGVASCFRVSVFVPCCLLLSLAVGRCPPLSLAVGRCLSLFPVPLCARGEPWLMFCTCAWGAVAVSPASAGVRGLWPGGSWYVFPGWASVHLLGSALVLLVSGALRFCVA